MKIIKIFKWITIIGLILLVSLSAFIEFLDLILPPTSDIDEASSSRIPFDSQKWKNATLYGTDDTRYRMYEDLIARYKLVGMTKDEIIELLGPESDPAYFKEWDLRYWMGPEPYGIDSVWLVMRIRDGRVVEYKIVTD